MHFDIAFQIVCTFSYIVAIEIVEADKYSLQPHQVPVAEEFPPVQPVVPPNPDCSYLQYQISGHQCDRFRWSPIAVEHDYNCWPEFANHFIDEKCDDWREWWLRRGCGEDFGALYVLTIFYDFGNKSGSQTCRYTIHVPNSYRILVGATKAESWGSGGWLTEDDAIVHSLCDGYSCLYQYNYSALPYRRYRTIEADGKTYVTVSQAHRSEARKTGIEVPFLVLGPRISRTCSTSMYAESSERSDRASDYGMTLQIPDTCAWKKMRDDPLGLLPPEKTKLRFQYWSFSTSNTGNSLAFYLTDYVANRLNDSEEMSCILGGIVIYHGLLEDFAKIKLWQCSVEESRVDLASSLGLVSFYADQGIIDSTNMSLSYYSERSEAEWPEDSSVIAFWPLNFDYGLLDIINCRSYTNWQRAVLEPGPFGDNQAALQIQSNGLTVSTLDASKKEETSSFTVAFFARIGPSTLAVPLIKILDSSGIAIISVMVQGSKIAIQLNNISLVRDNFIALPNSWGFVAITFDSSEKQISFWNSIGLIHSTDITEHGLRNNQIQTIIIGSLSNNQPVDNFPDKSILSCMGIYSTVLSPVQIFKFQRHTCPILHNGTMPGQPKAGNDFPWLVSIFNDTRHLCTGVIIDIWWILTALDCFDVHQRNSPEKFLIAVGNVDLTVIDQSERWHRVHRIFKQGEAKVALIQLESTANLSNPQVNVASLPSFYDGRPVTMDTEIFDTDGFVVGWANETTRFPAIIKGTLQNNANGIASAKAEENLFLQFASTLPSELGMLGAPFVQQPSNILIGLHIGDNNFISLRKLMPWLHKMLQYRLG